LQNLQVGESIMTSQQYADKEYYCVDEITKFEIVKEIIVNIRNIRASKNISPKERLILQVTGKHNNAFDAVIRKLANIDIEFVTEKSASTVSFLVGTTEFAVPLGNNIDVEAELAKLQSELAYMQGFFASVMKKLDNEKFVANAKSEVVEAERKKQADAESKIKTLEESIAGLRG
jgi:valyl-tRNA synthetase